MAEKVKAKVVVLGIGDLNPAAVEALCCWIEAEAKFIREEQHNLDKQRYTARWLVTDEGAG